MSIYGTPSDRRSMEKVYGSRDERPSAADHPRDRGVDLRHEAAEGSRRRPWQRDQELPQGDGDERARGRAAARSEAAPDRRHAAGRQDRPARAPAKLERRAARAAITRPVSSRADLPAGGLHLPSEPAPVSAAHTKAGARSYRRPCAARTTNALRSPLRSA